MIDELKKGAVVQFSANWGEEPTMFNTAQVTRMARDRSWADVSSVWGNKRVPNPDRYMRVVTDPIVIYVKEADE